MKVIVTTLSDEIYTLDISEELELKNLKAFVEFESGIPSSEFVLLHEGRPLFEDDRSLNFVGIKDGDIIVLQPIVQQGSVINDAEAAPSIDFSGIQIPGGSSTVPNITNNNIRGSNSGPSEDNPAYIRDMLLANLDQLALLKQNNPKLADALLSGNLDTFASVLKEQQESKKERERQRIRMLNADPFDVETQRLIADEIRQKNVDANMEAAMEHSPESFATVTMLYINCRVNGHPVKAFIDSGAQTTIMSAACAERCNIMRLVDHRWAGIAKGVGTQRIIGRVHMGQIQIENNFLLSSFSILEQQPMDMLLGLDMLKRHQCTIDLKSNQLKIGTTGTVTRFLSESELPDCARLNIQNEDEILKLSRQQEEDKALAEALEASARQAGGSCSSQTEPSPFATPLHIFPESDVQELMLLGFSRDQVLTQLTKFKGDKKNATAALFANVFGNAFNQSKQN